jgi:predicted nucleic acid-binding protein
MRFVDTNVLFYSLGLNLGEEEKRQRAIEILNELDCCLSVQVLQEFYSQATRASRPKPVPHEIAASLIQDWCRFPVQEMTIEIMNAALSTCRRFQISYWDAAVIEAARALGCRTVLSEDMQHGQDYGGIRVVNPFRN